MGKFIQEKSHNNFKFMTVLSIISSIVVLLIGLTLYFLPNLTNIIIGIIIGIIFILIGVFTLLKYFKRDGARLYSLNLLYGILLMIIGIISLIMPTLASNIVTVCTGLYMLIAGATRLSYGIWIKIGGHDSWFITSMIGVITIVCGIIVMFNPFEATKTLTEVVGIFLALSAVLDLTNTILLKRHTDEISQIFW